MMTTCARSGRRASSPGRGAAWTDERSVRGRKAAPGGAPAPGGSGGSPPRANSVIALRLFEQPVEVRRAEAGDCPVEPFHPPGPEVEVDRADRRLDRTPERPAVLACQAEQHRPGDLVAQRNAVIVGDQRFERRVGQAALGPDVAELEAGVVV